MPKTSSWRPPISKAKAEGLNVSLLLDRAVSIRAPPLGSSCSACELLNAAGQGVGTPLASPAKRRFPSWLCGDAVVPRFRHTVSAEADAFLDHVARGLPAILAGGALVPDASPVGSAWTAAELVQRLHGKSVVSMTAPAPARRAYTFYRSPNGKASEGGYDMDAYFRSGRYAVKGTHKVNAKGFLKRRDAADATEVPYLQVPLYTASAGWGQIEKEGLPAQIAHEVMSSLNIGALELIKKSGGWGRLTSSTLFVAPRDGLSTCHYDEVHNLFCQIRGHKSFLLFPPNAAAHLAPYPIHHWADRRARTDVEGLQEGDHAGAPLRGCAVEALVGPADTLFLPAYWFHHVHALDGDGVSFSLWYDLHATLAEEVARAIRPSSTQAARTTAARRAGVEAGVDLGASRHSLRVRLARESEAVVGATLGEHHARVFFLRLARRCADEEGCAPPAAYAGEGDDEAEALEPNLQEWLLGRLGELVGQTEVRSFVEQFLGKGRFAGIPVAVSAR